MDKCAAHSNSNISNMFSFYINQGEILFCLRREVLVGLVDLLTGSLCSLYLVAVV